ncbi:hypothetical protein LguiB_019858 [Lonicera macranthoides]
MDISFDVLARTSLALVSKGDWVKSNSIQALIPAEAPPYAEDTGNGARTFKAKSAQILQSRPHDDSHLGEFFKVCCERGNNNQFPNPPINPRNPFREFPQTLGGRKPSSNRILVQTKCKTCFAPILEYTDLVQNMFCTSAEYTVLVQKTFCTQSACTVLVQKTFCTQSACTVLVVIDGVNLMVASYGLHYELPET